MRGVPIFDQVLVHALSFANADDGAVQALAGRLPGGAGRLRQQLLQLVKAILEVAEPVLKLFDHLGGELGVLGGVLQKGVKLLLGCRDGLLEEFP